MHVKTDFSTWGFLETSAQESTPADVGEQVVMGMRGCFQMHFNSEKNCCSCIVL